MSRELTHADLAQLLIPCAYCGARPGQWCRAARRWTGDPYTAPFAQRPRATYLHGSRYWGMRAAMADPGRYGHDLAPDLQALYP